jgi:hypothetical protein
VNARQRWVTDVSPLVLTWGNFTSVDLRLTNGAR